MRASRAIAGAALGTCAALVAAVVRAQPAAEDARVSLTWRAPAGCPDEATVRADVGRLLAGSQASPVNARADVERRGESWRVVVAMNGGERRLEAASCRAIAEATALIVAMAVDPARVAVNRASLSVVDAGTPARAIEDAATVAIDAEVRDALVPPVLLAPPSAQLLSTPDAAPAEAASDASTSTPTPTPTSTPTPIPTALSETTFALSASGAIDLGTLPAPAVGVAIAFAWTPPRFRFELAGAYLFPDSTGSFLLTTRGLPPTLAVERFTLLAAAVRACYVARADSFDFGPCVEVEGASVHGSGLGIAHPSSGSSGWLAPGGEFFGAWRFASSWAVLVRVDALIPTIRPDFQVDSMTLHRPAFLTGRFSVGAELRF